jgi:hypothetical protein
MQSKDIKEVATKLQTLGELKFENLSWIYSKCSSFNNEVKLVFEVKRDFDYRVENRLTSCQIERPKIELYNVTCTKTPLRQPSVVV